MVAKYAINNEGHKVKVDGLSGTTWKSMMKSPGIIPIWVCAIGGAILAGGYVLRLATRNPDVSWTRKNPEPWQEYKNKQYKFIASGRDYSVPSPAPDYTKKD